MPEDIKPLQALGDLAQLASSLAPLLNGAIKLPGERIAELTLELLLEVVRSQPDEAKKQFWDWYVEDQRRWRAFWGLGD